MPEERHRLPRGGLARGERCLYVCCEHTSDEFRVGLRNVRTGL